MKIFTRVVIDIESGRVTGFDAYPYDGPLALAGGLFSKPPKPKPPPKIDDPEIQKRQDEERRRALFAMGRESTIITRQGQGLGSVG